MFISRKRIGGRDYSYLEEKINGKRISIYLGRGEQAEARLGGAFDELIGKTAVEMLKAGQKKFRPKFLSAAELLTLERLKIDYALLKDFFAQEFESFSESEFVRYAQGSASVEGNSLSLQEAALVLEKGASIAGKMVDEIREIENMKIAAVVSEKIKAINEKNIRKIHAAIMKGFDDKTPGEYRTGPMFITGSEVKPPRGGKVKEEMGKLMKWLEKNKGKAHPIELAAEFHARFEEIHPFNDGNGRTGREILNVMLRAYGYPRAIINMENRHSYVALLERVQMGKEYGKFSKFIYMCLEKRAEEIGEIVAGHRDEMLEKMMGKVRK